MLGLLSRADSETLLKMDTSNPQGTGIPLHLGLPFFWINHMVRVHPSPFLPFRAKESKAQRGAEAEIIRPEVRDAEPRALSIVLCLLPDRRLCQLANPLLGPGAIFLQYISWGTRLLANV